ncbi:unnamed protein product [Rhizophagus irregularis]|nr:unnamed protein product [Rhizophagus irregularis]
MKEISDQSGGSSSKKPNNSITSKTTLHKNVYSNFILQKLEADGFTTPNNKAEELEKNLTKPEHLYALKLLIEDLTNKFSSTVLTNLLKALADHTPFDHHSMEIVIRLELHLRTLAAVLERICFASIVLTKELRDKVYNSLAKFAEFHRKTTHVISEGLENVFRLDQFNQSQENDDDNIFQKRNYNIDFLLIHLRDTLHSLRDDETWLREMLRGVKDCLKATLTSVTEIPKAIPSIITHLRQGLSFKYPIASYYVGWRIMLIIRYNLFILSEDNVINKKIEEMTLMEYFWENLEIEWSNVVDKSILDSQSKFDEVLNGLAEVLMNAGSFLNDLVGNEPIALPHTLWFGILDLAQSYIQKSTRKATYGLCYYLAIESLNKAPSSFIQFKAIEILLHLYNINNELFSMIKIDFDQYTQKLIENKSTDSSEKFQNLLKFVKEKCFEDFAQLNIDFKLPNNDDEKGPILKEIADEMAEVRVFVRVFIKIIGESTSKMKRLNLDSNLSDIRKELEKNNNIIDDTFLFSTKQNNMFEEIDRDYEIDTLLNEIIEELDNSKNKFLYLMKYSRPQWKFLIKQCELQYGCTIGFDGIKTSNKRVFIMRDCEFNLFGAEKYKKGQFKYKSKEDWIKKKNLLFDTDINIWGFINLENKNFKDDNFYDSTYQYIELSKASLRFHKENLRLTKEFENEINYAIESKNPGEFKIITEKYGQFIPTEVIFGGRVYFKNDKTSHKIHNSNRKSNFHDFNYIHPDEENTWIESLKDYQNWVCIEFKNPISIFQLLPNNLYKEIYKIIGKKILYTCIENYDYYLYKPGLCGICVLRNMPQNILDVIMNKDADCDIFAAVIDTEEDLNDTFFNCQILHPSNVRPSVIIHAIQQQFQERKYKLKIGIMVIGYDINFNHIASNISIQSKKFIYESQNQCMFDSISLEHNNLDLMMKNNNPFMGISVLRSYDSSNKSLVIGHNFCKDENNKFKINIYSYCVKENCYVNLPKFTFHTFIITLNSPKYETYALPFKFNMCEKPFIDLNLQSTSLNLKPLFVSLYLLKDLDYNPIFLNQNSKQINIEYVNCKCNKTCPICMNNAKKLLESDNHYCLFFDPSCNFFKDHNFGPSELINSIIENKLVRFIEMDELSEMKEIGGGHFGTISKAIWKNNFIACKRLKNISSICNKLNEAFMHELGMHKKVDFCSRIIRILGISYVMHKGEAKIIDLGIAKSAETETNIHSGFREEPVPETPDEYLELYKSCWSEDPKLRPSIDEVYFKLNINNSNKNDNNISNTPDSKSKQNGESENNESDMYCIETGLI